MLVKFLPCGVRLFLLCVDPLWLGPLSVVVKGALRRFLHGGEMFLFSNPMLEPNYGFDINTYIVAENDVQTCFWEDA